MTELLSKDHTILERPFMEFRPFGHDERGDKIRDVSGITVRANVDYLEESVTRTAGAEAGERAVQELCRLLNARIRDSVYHVTPAFLRNKWNSYGAEFVAYLREFCVMLSGDPEFSFKVGREQHIGLIIQVLARPFTLNQIYRKIPYYSDKFAKGAVTEMVAATDGSAIIRRQFTEKTYQQYGPYRRRCAELICQAFKGTMIATPERVHHLPPATVKDRTCIANGDDWCEWEVTWTLHPERRLVWPVWKKIRGEASVGARGDRSATALPTGTTHRQANQRDEPVLLSKDHTILERPFMEFRPFGTDEFGNKIQDINGVVIKANVDQLEAHVALTKGREAGARAVEELCRLLNARIRDEACHVTPDFLKNAWHSYSIEFLCFLREFCVMLSGDPEFSFKVGREQHITPLIQALARPFPLPQLYRMFSYFSGQFAKGVSLNEVGMITNQSAILRRKFSDRTYQQFGPYRKRCAELGCQAVKGALTAAPERVHHLPSATVKDRTCIASGDDWCEWEVTWAPQPRGRAFPPAWGILAGGGIFTYLTFFHPIVTTWEAFGIALFAIAASWLTGLRLRRQAKAREALIQEQVQFLEARHEELREVYLEQEQTQVELRRRVNQLTTLHRAGLLFSSTLDRETMIRDVLETLIRDLHYDHALLSFFDPDRRVIYDSRILGVSEDVAAYARSHEVPVTEPASPEGVVLLHGKSLLIGDVREVWSRLHPHHQHLATMIGTKSVIIAPLRAEGRILGALMVDRTQEHSLSQDDLDLVVTVANQVAIALDNVDAYRQIEALNVGLEAKVRERTAELERLNQSLKTANDQLQELDRLKSEFFANISHEFRTPLTLSVGAFNALMKLSPTAQAKSEIQTGLRNTARLLSLINEFLDLAKFDSGLMELRKQCIDFAALVRAIAANFESADHRRVHFRGVGAPVPIEADLQQMKKVLYNLLSNAFKFSDPEGGQVWIRVGSKGDRVELEVEDNGIGIPRDQFDRIFQRFTQVEGSATRRYEGTGIGLALVKEIVTAHGGTVTVESELGRGSTFTVSLPRGAASSDTMEAIEEDDAAMLSALEEEPPKRTSPAAPLSATGGDRPLVLVVDDNADMRGYLARLLSTQYRIILAKDGAEGLEQTKTFHPDLVITDVMMPRMSGHDLLKAVRGDSALRSVPVLFLTARAGAEARIESLEAGADDYIAKPFDENEVLARVGNLIRARAQERELTELQKEKLTQFLPAQVAEAIFSDRADEVLKSHRAEITVVFIDLRGFTAFADTATPEDVAAVLQEYQYAMGRVVADHDGVLERYSGDAMMIFFNDPVPVSNHAEQAVRMAVAMRQRIEQLRQAWSRRGIELGAGIGIATGYATVGLVGCDRRKDYAAIGTVTNLAARLCGEAQHGQILISERVLHLVKEAVRAESVGNLTLKGFHKPMPAHNVTGLAEERPPSTHKKTKKEKRR